MGSEGLNAGGWFSDDARFEEIPDEIAAASTQLEAEGGGMDVD